MCNYNYAPGAVHLDIHHNNISTMPSMIRELVHSFASNAAPNDVAEVVSDTDEIPDEELFKYIHPSITAEDEKRQIHLEIRNLVQHLPLPEICKYLRQMYKQKRVYLNVKSESMFDELHRMGMPDESNQGFSQKNFLNYFNIND